MLVLVPNKLWPGSDKGSIFWNLAGGLVWLQHNHTGQMSQPAGANYSNFNVSDQARVHAGDNYISTLNPPPSHTILSQSINSFAGPSQAITTVSSASVLQQRQELHRPRGHHQGLRE